MAFELEHQFSLGLEPAHTQQIWTWASHYNHKEPIPYNLYTQILFVLFLLGTLTNTVIVSTDRRKITLEFVTYLQLKYTTAIAWMLGEERWN